MDEENSRYSYNKSKLECDQMIWRSLVSDNILNCIKTKQIKMTTLVLD